jgi:hypothetical protein
VNSATFVSFGCMFMSPAITVGDVPPQAERASNCEGVGFEMVPTTRVATGTDVIGR